MKKMLAMILILLSACVFTAAQAENIEIYRDNALFYIEVALPNGARVDDSVVDDYLSKTVLEYITSGKPSVVITVAPDESYFGLSLSDLSKEEVELIIGEITMEMTEPSEDIRKTADGHEYIIVNETTPDNDTCDSVMLINGYFIMVQVFHEGFSELTEQDMQIGPSIMETLRFVGNTNT